ncbi:MAG: nicotinate phosphoribosyltransferase [Methylococcales bacterium]|nr:nicotinate phosphoribosyltransferase [Methylococcales bacterium]MBT7408801.1 nicotinate phosphoribosyltransferase [Methylococcales bacterium]
MSNQSIIQSLLDTDLYKLTMMQVVFHHFSTAQVEYTFKCRTKGADLLPLENDIYDEISALCQLTFSEEELDYLGKISYLKADFIDYLAQFKLDKNTVQMGKDNEGQLEIKVIGSWLQTILFEVPVLAIVEELYARQHDSDINLDFGKQRLMEKIQQIQSHPLGKQFKLMEFGTRRRLSRSWQAQVLQQLSDNIPSNLLGTSNIFFAKSMNLMPLGTMAHEYLQAFQALGTTLAKSQQEALICWMAEYQGDLSIALTDVVGIDAFIRDFDGVLAQQFEGVRHDSGCPFEWARKMMAHYEQLGIDPSTKKLVFSDGLDISLALKLLTEFHDAVQVSFGIGTNLTNDVGIEPLSIVMKMTQCNGQPVAKISDSPGKTMCQDDAYLAQLKQSFAVSE